MFEELVTCPASALSMVTLKRTSQCVFTASVPMLSPVPCNTGDVPPTSFDVTPHVFVVDPASYMVKESFIYDQQDGVNHMKFHDVKTNEGAPASKFEFCRIRRSPPNLKVDVPRTQVSPSAKLQLFEVR